MSRPCWWLVLTAVASIHVCRNIEHNEICLCISQDSDAAVYIMACMVQQHGIHPCTFLHISKDGTQRVMQLCSAAVDSIFCWGSRIIAVQFECEQVTYICLMWLALVVIVGILATWHLMHIMHMPLSWQCEPGSLHCCWHQRAYCCKSTAASTQ